MVRERIEAYEAYIYIKKARNKVDKSKIQIKKINYYIMLRLSSHSVFNVI